MGSLIWVDSLLAFVLMITFLMGDSGTKLKHVVAILDSIWKGAFFFLTPSHGFQNASTDLSRIPKKHRSQMFQNLFWTYSIFRMRGDLDSIFSLNGIWLSICFPIFLTCFAKKAIDFGIELYGVSNPRKNPCQVEYVDGKDTLTFCDSHSDPGCHGVQAKRLKAVGIMWTWMDVQTKTQIGRWNEDFFPWISSGHEKESFELKTCPLIAASYVS